MIVRVGEVTAVNYETGKVRVTYHDQEDATTKDIACLTFNDEYKMPSIGELVLVLHMENGSSVGFVLGTFWSGTHAPKETGNLYRKDLDKDAYIKCESGNVEVHAKDITFVCDSGSISISEIISMKAGGGA